MAMSLRTPGGCHGGSGIARRMRMCDRARNGLRPEKYQQQYEEHRTTDPHGPHAARCRPALADARRRFGTKQWSIVHDLSPVLARGRLACAAMTLNCHAAPAGGSLRRFVSRRAQLFSIGNAGHARRWTGPLQDRAHPLEIFTDEAPENWRAVIVQQNHPALPVVSFRASVWIHRSCSHSQSSYPTCTTFAMPAIWW